MKWSYPRIGWSPESQLGGDFWSSEGHLGAQICIEKAFDIGFRGSGGLWGTKRRPGKPQEAPKKLQEAPTRVLWELFGVQEAPRNLPKPRSRIHSSFSEPPRDSPEAPKSRSIDPVEILEPPAGDKGVTIMREPGPVGPPDTLAQASLDLYYWKTTSKRRCSLLT